MTAIRSHRAARSIGAALRYSGVSLLALISLFPFGWMVLTAIKPANEIRSVPVRWWPEQPTLENFANVFAERDLAGLLLNSLIVATSTAMITTTIAVLAAYALARLMRRSAVAVTLAILMAQMLPTVLLVVPYFIMFRNVGLLDTLPVLIITNVSFTLPITTWLLRRFVQKVPKELDEAAMVDGCTRFGALVRVIVPAARPGIAAAFIYTFLVSWHEYLFALSLTSSADTRVVTVGIAGLIGQYGVSWGELMAMGVIAIIPLIVVFLLVEKHLVEGLAGGVKG
ncbi:carbohydrate ABC transporter permease [Pseudolysinimonas sp.]